MRPSIFAVFISAPLSNNRFTSSWSPLEHAAKKIHPSWNFTFFCLFIVWFSHLFVSDSSHLFNCSCLLWIALTRLLSSAMTAALQICKFGKISYKLWNETSKMAAPLVFSCRCTHILCKPSKITRASLVQNSLYGQKSYSQTREEDTQKDAARQSKY